ncbi:MAG TPA: ATP-grasp domain-containing protein, partial [Vicinamibacterales bacterium]|nr:ATP-grasp domain-containing protein [Vicinamibacterales bacterium]
VLVAGAGGSSAVAAIRALDGDALDVFSADADPHAPGLCLVGEDRRLPVSKGRGDSYTESVYELCERHRIDVLIPAVDRELLLLASARVFFAEIGTRIVLPSEKTLRMCLDKWALHRRCDGTVGMPDSMLVGEDFDPSHPKLPVIVKPRAAGGSRQVQLIERREELERIDRDGSLLVQEHLPGAEYSLATLARSDGKVIAVVPWARSHGTSRVAASAHIVRDGGLEKIGRQIAARIGLTSLASIQVKGSSDGNLALLKVNPYFTKTMPLAATSGVNLLKLCIDDLLPDD